MKSFFKDLKVRLPKLFNEKAVVFISILISSIAITISYQKGLIVAYGDAESHLNIAKRIVDSLTPGFSQLGGIWLPLPHLLMVPFIYSDFLWRSGLAGSIVSGISYIISGLFLYKIMKLLFKNTSASFIGFLIFATNPNILYMQTTPMTELPLICFFILSTYYFFKFLINDKDYLSLIFAGFFGFCATLSRYDGWFLVAAEALAIGIYYLFKQLKTKGFNFTSEAGYLQIMEGNTILFSTLAFFGIIIWLFWDLLILGDPFYFTHSQFSANAQQQSWLARGELPAYKNIITSAVYYTVTAEANSGILIFSLAILGLIIYLIAERKVSSYLLLLLLFVPFIFNIITLYLGESVIFIPFLTPQSYQWRLFNVRYGMLMVPTFALLIGYLSNKTNYLKPLILICLILQLAIFTTGFQSIITLQDATSGLSAYKQPDAQFFLKDHYDKGLVLLDDYARTISILRTNIPMQNIIYVGNKPYWDESLKHPEKYATWIVMQKDDSVWTSIYDNPATQAELYKYFQKVYTSPNILIFKRDY